MTLSLRSREWKPAYSDDEDDIGYINIFAHFSPKASHDAWVPFNTLQCLVNILLKLAMYNKVREINLLNVLNTRSATNSFKDSLILNDLEAVSVADFLKQLSLDNDRRRKTGEENIRKQNADVLDALAKALNATKARAEE